VLAPGIEVSMEALFARAARLVKVDFVESPAAIGKSTATALQSGVVYGFAGQVDGLVRRIEAELGEKATVVATGGLAPLVLGESETLQHYEPELTLIGLRIVFHKNIEPRTSGPGPVLHHIAGT
jgi:type III pantothenate kinase